ncbi:MAG TPA: META domain-containing protein [Jatrophihabitans sp.]|nr:META domain-containing protein [Jatrophihabitans sp.]
MTDEQMDARLRRTGEAWRAAEAPTAAGVATRVETLAVAPTRKPPRSRRFGLLASAAVVAAALVAGGGFLVANLGSDGGPTPIESGPLSLTGTNWALVGITDAAGHDVPVAGNPTLGIDDSNHVGGTDGCNKFGGDVTVDGAVIRFGALEISAMACPDDQVTATAEQVDATLSGDVTWSTSNDELTLSKADVGTLIYRSVPSEDTSTDPNDLIGSDWALTTIERGATAASTPAVVFTFGADGVRDSADNAAGARISAGTITFTTRWTNGLTTSADQGLSPSDSQFVYGRLLTGHVTWVVEGDQLKITKDGVGALIYAPSGGGKADLASLLGHTWTLNGIEHQTAAGGSASGSSSMSDITITFDKVARITIKHRCYTDKGKVQVGDSTLDIRGITPDGTVPCTSPTDPNENRTNSTVDRILTGSVQWQITNGQLQITKGDTTLDFSDAGTPEQQQPQLSGTLWKLTNDSQVTLIFDGGISYRLETGCHTYTGHAKIAGATMTLYDQRDQGGLDCLNLKAEQVRKLLESGEAAWSIQDGTLVLGRDGVKIEFSSK